MFATAMRYMAALPKQEMKLIELGGPPEQTQTITRAIFDLLKEHGPLTMVEIWDRVKEMGLKGLHEKQHMKIVFKRMKKRQKIKEICYGVGRNKQVLYTTWFTKPDVRQTPCRTVTSRPGSNHYKDL